MLLKRYIGNKQNINQKKGFNQIQLFFLLKIRIDPKQKLTLQRKNKIHRDIDNAELHGSWTCGKVGSCSRYITGGSGQI